MTELPLDHPFTNKPEPNFEFKVGRGRHPGRGKAASPRAGAACPWGARAGLQGTAQSTLCLAIVAQVRTRKVSGRHAQPRAQRVCCAGGSSAASLKAARPAKRHRQPASPAPAAEPDICGAHVADRPAARGREGGGDQVQARRVRREGRMGQAGRHSKLTLISCPQRCLRDCLHASLPACLHALPCLPMPVACPHLHHASARLPCPALVQHQGIHGDWRPPYHGTGARAAARLDAKAAGIRTAFSGCCSSCAAPAASLLHLLCKLTSQQWSTANCSPSSPPACRRLPSRLASSMRRSMPRAGPSWSRVSGACRAKVRGLGTCARAGDRYGWWRQGCGCNGAPAPGTSGATMLPPL